MDSPRIEGLAAALRTDLPALLDRWMALYQASSIRLPGSFDEAAVRRAAEPILASMADAMPADDLSPGSPELRDVEKTLAFSASSWATDGGSGFDLVGLLVAAREALLERASQGERAALMRLFDWMVALAADAFGDGGVRAEKERQREALERGLPVTAIAPEVPATFLVGAPDTFTFDAVFGRLLMLVVRMGAHSVIVDATGLDAAAAPAAIVSLDRFLRHRKLAGVRVLAVGLEVEAEQAWRKLAERAGATLEVHPAFDLALARALETTGYRLVRRPGLG